MIEEFDDNMGQLLMVLRFKDEAIPGVTDTIASAQGAGSEALEDEDEYMVYEDIHFIPLFDGLILHLQLLTTNWWNKASNGRGCVVASIREGVAAKIG